MAENLEKLILELLRYPSELPWLEFKHDNYEPFTIGQDISALANGAALEDKNAAYFLWGIDDSTHEIIGTDYNLQNLKKGAQELENWLRGLLSQNADFEYHLVSVNGNNVGVLKIQAATWQPVTFEKTAFIEWEVIRKSYKIILHCKCVCGINYKISILKIRRLVKT